MEIELAVDLLEKNEKYLEIELILDELNVIVHLDFSKNYSLWIKSADTSDILYKVEEEGGIDGPEAVAMAIKKMRKTLDQLYYYKPIGKYLLKKEKRTVLISKLFKKFFDTDKCCVCFEETSVIITCYHYCCHKCIEKTKFCPICGQDLYG